MFEIGKVYKSGNNEKNVQSNEGGFIIGKEYQGTQSIQSPVDSLTTYQPWKAGTQNIDKGLIKYAEGNPIPHINPTNQNSYDGKLLISNFLSEKYNGERAKLQAEILQLNSQLNKLPLNSIATDNEKANSASLKQRNLLMQQLKEKEEQISLLEKISNSYNSGNINEALKSYNTYTLDKPEFAEDKALSPNATTEWFQKINNKQISADFLTKASEIVPYYEDFEKYAGNFELDVKLADSQYMTKTEKGIFNYLKNKSGMDAAQKYYENLKLTEFHNRYYDEQMEAASEFGNKHPVLASGISLGTNLASTFEQAGAMGAYLASQGNYKIPKNYASGLTSSLRGAVSEKVNLEIAGFDAFDFVYNAGMSAADSIVSGSLLGPAAPIALGLSAAASSSNDILERGGTNEQAFWTGLTAGVFESVFEKVSLGNFKVLKEVAPDSVKTVIKNIAKSMLVNASEESATEIANILYDTIANADISNYSALVKEYKESGLSEDKAKLKAVHTLAMQVLEAGASGALMGFGFGTAGSVMGYANNKNTNNNQKNTADSGGARYSIAVLDNGNTYVKASRSIISGDDISSWRKQITNFFNELLENNNSIDVSTIEGDVLTITKSETADKARDNYKYENGKRIKLTDAEFKVKLNVEAHIDEITETSIADSKKLPDTKSHNFAKDGFTYRTAYFEDFDGQYYKIKLSVGYNGETATVYSVGKIKKDSLPSAAKLVAVVGSKPLGKLSNNIIRNENETVKGNNENSIFTEHSNQGLQNEADGGIINAKEGESYARTDEFRSLQAEVQGMSDDITQSYHSGSREIDGEIRGRLSRTFRLELQSASGKRNYNKRTLLNPKSKRNVNILENVDGELFHDVFEIARHYLENGELVDLHTIETTEDGIGYDDCTNYLSEDGLSGFSITPDGDLISVFNLSDERGFLKTIAPIVKEKSKTLDCYASEKQNLMIMYQKIFGFKTASTMDYNMEYDHDGIAENHGMPQVSFMVNSDSEVEPKHFTAEQYEEAKAYRDSFVENNDVSETDSDESVFSVFTEHSAQGPTPDAVKDYVYKTNGSQRHTEEQSRIVHIANKLGRKVVFKTFNDNADGYIEDGVIYINTKAQKPIEFIFKHELTHYAEGSELYGLFVKAVKESKAFENWINERVSGEGSVGHKAAVYRENTINRYAQNGITLSVAEAENELIADFVGENLFDLDGSGLESIMNDMTAPQRKTFTQYIKDFIEYIKQKMSRTKAGTNDILKLEKMFNEVLSTVDENNTADSGVRYSFESGFENQINNIQNIPSNEAIVVCGTPKVFLDIGLNNLPMTLNLEHAKDAITLNPEHKDRYIGKDTLLDLPNALKKPIAIITSATNKDTSLVVIVELKGQNGRSVIAPVYLNGLSRTNGLIIDSNSIASVHERKNAISSLLTNALNDEASGNIGIYYIDKSKAKQLAVGEGLQLPNILTKLNGFIHSISEKGSPVNKSFKKIAQTETKQFKKWFGKSKVVDKNGEPLIVYHGTNADFTKFDFEKIGTNTNNEGIFGKGYYFTNDSKYAEYYNRKDGNLANDGSGKVMSVYLKMQNPFIWNDVAKNKDDIIKLSEKLGLPEGVLRYNRIEGQAALGTLRDNDKIRQFTNALKKHGYDGVIYSYPEDNTKEYVVFEPNQIKSVTDNIGTFDGNNPDIRYSIPESQSNLLSRYENGEISRDEYIEQLNENWGKANEKFGIMPQGEKAVTPIAVPKAVESGKFTRRFTRTILETGTVTGEMLEDMSGDILLGKYSYEPISDEKAQVKADDIIAEKQGKNVWNEAVYSSKQIGKNEIAVGEKMLLQAISDGDTKRVLELSAELAEVLTRSGQVIQAARMIKKMSGVGKLMTVQRMVDTINSDLKKKYKDNAPTVQLDELIAQQLGSLQVGEDSESIYQDALIDIAAQVPATWLDKWNAWRYMAMLANPITHIRNTVGNAIFLPTVRLKDFSAAIMEAAFVDESKRTKAVVIGKEYKVFAEKDVKNQNVIKALKSGGFGNIKSEISEHQRIFETKALEFVRNFNSNLLESEDLIFKNIHYKHALAGFLQARKVDLNNVSEDILWQARDYAVQEAMKATFNDVNKISSALTRAAQSNMAVDIGVNGILAFKKTPINIVRRGVEYSPIGLIKTLSKGIYDLKKGKISSTEFIDGLGAGISGSVPFAIGMLLSSLGYVTGGFGDNDEDKFKELNGEQEYSLRLFGRSYTIDWAAPACIPFFIGVELMEALREDKEDFKLSDITDVMWNSLEPLLNLSMFSGIQGLIESVRYADKDKLLWSLAGNIIKSYFSQAIPTIFGKVARTTDSTKRNNYYTDKNSQLSPFAQGVVNTVKSKIPGLENTQPEYVNAWGETESNGNVFERVFGNFVSPGYYSKIEYNELSNELMRLNKAVDNDDLTILPKEADKSFEVNGVTKHLTADEYVKYAKAKGKYSVDYINEFINSSKYEKLNDEERADVINNLYKYANAKAKTEVSDFDITKSHKTAAKYDKRGRVVTYYIGRALAKDKN